MPSFHSFLDKTYHTWGPCALQT